MPKRTKYGHETFEKIEGFKRYLETVEQPNLESMVNDNPTYFYNILPYMYVLGISEEVTKKFNFIALQPYNDDSFFPYNDISSLCDDMSSIGSDSSGGGSSGDGDGGGGGGSW